MKSYEVGRRKDTNFKKSNIDNIAQTATDTNIDISKNINNVYGHTNIVNIYWHISGIH